MPKGIYTRTSLEERILKLISKEESTGCWLYQGHLDRYGYGQISINSNTTTVHRCMYKLKKGEIKEGYIVGHLCDEKYATDSKVNRRCCNPDHLQLMTIKENNARTKELQRSVISSGAFKPGHGSGENNIKSKLSTVIIVEIRSRFMKGVAYGELLKWAEEYNISYTTIQAIVGRKGYRATEIPEGWLEFKGWV
jgi:hypothetical protein